VVVAAALSKLAAPGGMIVVTAVPPHGGAKDGAVATVVSHTGGNRGGGMGGGAVRHGLGRGCMGGVGGAGRLSGPIVAGRGSLDVATPFAAPPVPSACIEVAITSTAGALRRAVGVGLESAAVPAETYWPGAGAWHGTAADPADRGGTMEVVAVAPGPAAWKWAAMASSRMSTCRLKDSS